MSRGNSKTWSDFMSSEYAQQELAKIQKQAQQWSVQNDREPLYNVDPGNKTELSKSETTQGVKPGGASMVGSDDRAPLYTTSPSPVQGGAEQYADGTVEGLEDIASAMMNVATKAPTGKPTGTQDNSSEDWDGMKAAGGKTVKNFTKKAQELMMDFGDFGDEAEDEISLVGDEGDDLESILAELEEAELEEEENTEDDFSHVGYEPNWMPKTEVTQQFAKVNKKKTVALLKELVKIANECDSKGQFSDAEEIDNVIKDEVQTLLASRNVVAKKCACGKCKGKCECKTSCKPCAKAKK